MKIKIFFLFSLLALINISCHPNLPKTPPIPIISTLSTATALVNEIECSVSGNVLVYFTDTDNFYTATIKESEMQLGHVIESPNAPITMMSLSPDGTKLIYLYENNIYLQNITTDDLNQINHEMVGSIGGNIRWSPDNKKFVLSCSTPNAPKPSICLVDIASGNIETLVTLEKIGSSYPDFYLTLDDWSQDGSIIIFTKFAPMEKGQKQDFEIYAYEWGTQRIQQIFNGNSQNLIMQIIEATISPDNSRLLITGSGRQSLSQIYQLDINGENLKQLTEMENVSVSSPLWAEDSSCFYASLHQNNTILEKSFAVFNAKGNLISYIDFTRTIKGWIR